MSLRRPRHRHALVATAVLVGALAGCSGSPADPLGGLSGCLEGDTGTIAVGVANTSGDALVVEGVELADSNGVEIVDRFIVIDEDARSTAVRFDSGGRDAVDGVDLDQLAIEPGAAAFVGVDVVRISGDEGRVDGLVITVDGTDQAVPVTLDLRDDCG